MKLHVRSQTQEPIGGFETLVVERNNIDLSKISDNECEVILAADVLDSFTCASVEQLVAALVTKLRLNGEIILGGTDIRLFAKALTNGLITLEDASNVITNVHSMTNIEKTREVLIGAGLEVQSAHLDGIHYEVKAKRVK